MIVKANVYAEYEMRFYILKTGFMKSCYADWRSKIIITCSK